MTGVPGSYILGTNPDAGGAEVGRCGVVLVPNTEVRLGDKNSPS